ncbi:MAG: hypothetical protein R3B90_14305 [Planctomycetaceae bacterium]
MLAMPLAEPMNRTGLTLPLLVDPAYFAQQLVSHAPYSRADEPQDDMLGLRNDLTGELLRVQGTRFRQWMRERN